MRLARFGAVLLAAAIASMAAWGGAHAQEASAEITATVTVIPPPIEISPSDLNFGSLLPGDTVDIQGNLWEWGANDHWPGRLEIENLHGAGSFSVRFTVVEPLTNGDATLDLVWDTDGHAAARIEKTDGPGNHPPEHQTWAPVSGVAHELFASPSAGQGAPVTWTVNATVFIGGRVGWTGDEPPGVYTGSIKAEVGFLDQ